MAFVAAPMPATGQLPPTNHWANVVNVYAAFLTTFVTQAAPLFVALLFTPRIVGARFQFATVQLTIHETTATTDLGC